MQRKPSKRRRRDVTPLAYKLEIRLEQTGKRTGQPGDFELIYPPKGIYTFSDPPGLRRSFDLVLQTDNEEEERERKDLEDRLRVVDRNRGVMVIPTRDGYGKVEIVLKLYQRDMFFYQIGLSGQETDRLIAICDGFAMDLLDQFCSNYPHREDYLVGKVLCDYLEESGFVSESTRLREAIYNREN